MKTVVRMQFGSHVYGTNVPTSDTDYKAVHLPTADEILLQQVKASFITKTNGSTARNTAADVDFESLSLQRFMELLLQGQTMALNMLFTPDEFLLETTPLWEEIRERRASWLHSGVSAFVGYCRQQANRYGIRGSRVATARATVEFFDRMIEKNGPRTKLKDVWHKVYDFHLDQDHAEVVTGYFNGDVPVRMLEVCNRRVQEHVTLREARSVFGKILENYGQRALAAERNEGVDYKATMHAVRVCHEAQELLLTGHITYPRPEAGLLLQIRKGELPYAQVAELIEQGMADVEAAGARSALPKEPDHQAAERVVLGAYRGVISESV